MLIHSDAGVGHRDRNVLTSRDLVPSLQRDIRRTDCQQTAIWHGIARVERKIEDARLDLTWFDHRWPQIASQTGLDPDALSVRRGTQ